MLSWITGAKGSDVGTIPHCDSFIEAPETPAPVFAVRAFKHAIFGTPKPLETDTQDRFNDIASTMKPKVPILPASSDHAGAPQQKHDMLKAMSLPETLGLSPSKPNGILMTPGTTRRNKSVTFGAQVVDNEGKKAGRSGLPNTCPGKFPSPWTPKTEIDGLSDASTSSQKRTKLTQTLHDVRDSSRSDRMVARGAVKSKDDLDITLDFMEPRAQSGKYWKQEYDAYAEKTQREVKRLLMKQKAAKDFARAKDAEVLDLTEKLRQEARKAERLEAKMKELEREMDDLRKKFELGNSARPSGDPAGTQNEAARLRLENWKLREELGRAQGKPPSAQSSPRRRPAQPENADIWADAVASSPFVVDAASPRRVTSPKNDTFPLSHRSVNTLPTSPRRSRSKSRDPVVELTPKQTSGKSTLRGRHASPELLNDTLDLSLALPQPSPEPVHRSAPRSDTRTPRSSRRTAADKSIDDLLERYSPSKSMMMSSPPPKFDRMALPIGMPSTDFTASTTQRQILPKKPSLKESFAKAGNPLGDTAAELQNASVRPPREKASAVPGVAPTEEGKSKKQLSEDRKAAALERIAARRLKTSKAA